MTKKKRLKIFCDFDGTAAKEDVWVNSLGKFVKDKKSHEELIENFESENISTRECITSELKLVEDFDITLFNKYIDDELLDPYFKEFTEFCNTKGYPVVILSEGFGHYIERILNNNGIDLKYYCNELIINDDSSLMCRFPYTDENCNRCGVCKRNILINNTNDFEGEISVYIGDSVTDFCVSNYADIVFAKGTLASYCWKHNITYFEYNNFSDIIKKLEKLEHNYKLKHRQEAKNKRRDVLMGG